MKKSLPIIDIFVHIVDNYGDMGFLCEFVQACQLGGLDSYQYIIWTNDVVAVQDFVRRTGISSFTIGDIVDFGYLRKSAIGISLLHCPLPDLNRFESKACILRIDYLSLDRTWIGNNEKEHLASTENRQIIELIPSPISGGAGLIPFSKSGKSESPWKYPHITIFSYPDTLDRIDWDSFPEDLVVYVFGKINVAHEHIISLDLVTLAEFYQCIDSSEFALIRGEVSFAHAIQGNIPFFWDIYKNIGGFPKDQSEQFLSLIRAPREYRESHQKINGQNPLRITYQDMCSALSHTHFPRFRTQNLIHTVKKHIDRFHNSI